MSYIGNPIVSTDFPVDYASGNGSTTAFTLSIAPASVNAVDVEVSGVSQSPQTYTISGTTLTFSAAPPSGTNNIVFKHRGVAGIPNTPSAGSVVTSSIADGVITAAKFASGQTPSFNGITFPATQVPSADANTLDDYEEGTFTPTIRGGTVSGTTTYSNQNGYYTKIGKAVTIIIYLRWTAITGTGDFIVGGLPFTSNNDTQNYSSGAILLNNLNWGGGSMLTPLQYINSTDIRLFYQSDDGAATVQQCVNEAADIRITMTYFAS